MWNYISTLKTGFLKFGNISRVKTYNNRNFRTFQGGYPIILSKAGTRHQSEILFYPKRWFSSDLKGTLMNSVIVAYPSISNVFKMFYNNYFVMRNLDGSFKLFEFAKNSRTAMVIVTKLLSEARYSDLEPLMTNECKAEVVENVKALRPNERMSVAINDEENITMCFPHDLEVTKEGVNGERNVAQITMVYVINIARSTEDAFLQECKIYNTRYIRDVTTGSDDQWTINSINVKTYKVEA